MAIANTTLCLPASLASLATLSEGLHDFVAPFLLDPAVVYQMDLASSEAFTNIVKHAVNYDADQKVIITLGIDGQQLILTLSDPGLPIPADILRNSLRASALSPDPSNPSEWPEGGMGLILIQSVMDNVQYETVNGLNRLTLSKSLSSDSA